MVLGCPTGEGVQSATGSASRAWVWRRAREKPGHMLYCNRQQSQYTTGRVRGSYQHSEVRGDLADKGFRTVGSRRGLYTFSRMLSFQA
jgi:hypothetical protein